MVKKSRSLRWQLVVLMAIIAITECVVLILALAMSGVFTELDAEAFRLFNNDSSERALSLDNNLGRLIHNMTNAVDTLTEDAQQLAARANVPLQDAYKDNDLYNAIAEQCGAQLIEFLNANSVSAAFCVFTGSNTHPDDPECHSAVYIRDAAPGVLDAGQRNLQLEVGPLAVAREYRMAASTHWELDMKVGDGESGAFYTKPVEAAEAYPRSELVRYAYWSPPSVIIPGDQDSISYSLPILAKDGTPIGVMGFEMTETYFTTDYLSNTNMPYQGSFFAITSGTGDVLNTDWMIPGSPSAAERLHKGEDIPITPLNGTDIYETSLDGSGPMYCSVHELTLYSRNSPFADQGWLLVGMVEQGVLNETSSSIARTITTAMLTTLGVAFAAILVLSLVSTRKIAGLSRFINEASPGADIHFEPTDLREIDELTAAIERLNRRINDSVKVTSKMMELTQLPLGGFEISDDMDTVVLTEYIYRLLNLKEGEPISKEDWKELYAELTSHPADGYPDVYRYDAARLRSTPYGSILRAAEERFHAGDENEEDLYQYTVGDNDRQKWLRIIEAPTENGTVGMIIDTTSDIDEIMRMAYELDYDALTRLYNRTAFKREAFKKITQNPDMVGVMIFSDLDNLKGINDTYGHEMGDLLITSAADMFREFSDYGGIVARMSGDEFAMFLYGYETKEEIMDIVKRLYTGFKKKNFKTPDGKTQWISSSSGMAWYPQDSADIADLLKLSDYAMYEAKQSKKGTLFEKDGTLFDFGEEPYMENNETKNTTGSLKQLIDERRFRFVFQPIVDLHTAEIYGYEAFMKPQMQGYTTPGEVLSAARSQHLLGPLESALVLKILEDTQMELRAIGDRKIFINSIPGERLTDDDWDIVREDYSRILPHIVMEVTEAENDDLDSMLIKLRKLRRMHIPVAIDDFGQGYSNEVRIIAMQPSIIKIDLELIRNLHADPEKQRIVSDLVQFAHAQGVKVAAEGVEMEMELETVVRFGLDYAQGFLIGRPNFQFQALREPVKELLEQLRDEQEEDGEDSHKPHE